MIELNPFRSPDRSIGSSLSAMRVGLIAVGLLLQLIRLVAQNSQRVRRAPASRSALESQKGPGRAPER